MTTREQIEAPADGFTPDEFQHIAELIRLHANDITGAGVEAVVSNNFNVILAALDRAALARPASPEVKGEPVGYTSKIGLEMLVRDGRPAYLTRTPGTKQTEPLYASPPADSGGLREALYEIEGVASGSTTANSLPHIAKIAKAALSAQPALPEAFITCNSGPDTKPSVQIQTATLAAAHRWHNAVLSLARSK